MSDDNEMTQADEGEIRAAAVAWSAARDQEYGLAAVNVAALDEAERAQLRAEYAVAQARTRRAWVALRRAQRIEA